MSKIFKEIDYANAYTELLEILKYIPDEDFYKIDKDELEYYQEKCNKDHFFKYNPEKDLNEQNVSELTKYLIIILFKNYWATDEQRAKLKQLQRKNELDNEAKKSTLYNHDMFGSKVSVVQDAVNQIDTKNLEMIEYKKSKIKMLMNKIFSVFKKNQK